MEIDFKELIYKDDIKLDNIINLPENIYSDTEIVKVEDLKVTGIIKYNIEDNYEINLDLSGKMYLHDALTDELVPYSFSTNIEEILENSTKSLDLIEFLWHYIVLEIPLRYTTKESLDVKGKDYQVISEEEYSLNNNPFKDL